MVSAAFGTSVEKSLEAIFAVGTIKISAAVEIFAEGALGTKSALGTDVSQMILRSTDVS